MNIRIDFALMMSLTIVTAFSSSTTKADDKICALKCGIYYLLQGPEEPLAARYWSEGSSVESAFSNGQASVSGGHSPDLDEDHYLQFGAVAVKGKSLDIWLKQGWDYGTLPAWDDSMVAELRGPEPAKGQEIALWWNPTQPAVSINGEFLLAVAVKCIEN